MKWMSILFSVLFTLILLSGCISIPTGDGESIELGSEGVTITSKDGEETEIKADAEGGTVSIEGTDAEGNKTSIHSKASEDIPADFPESIPIPDEAVIKFGQANEVNDSQQFTVAYEVENGDFATYEDMYRKYAEDAGFEIITDSTYADSIQFLSHKDNENFSFIIEQKDTGIAVTVSMMINQGE